MNTVAKKVLTVALLGTSIVLAGCPHVHGPFGPRPPHPHRFPRLSQPADMNVQNQVQPQVAVLADRQTSN